MFFFFNDTATTEIYTLSLHDALPICLRGVSFGDSLIKHVVETLTANPDAMAQARQLADRKSTRLNSSHLVISYAVFCLKKKRQLIPSTEAVKHPQSTPTCPKPA